MIFSTIKNYIIAVLGIITSIAVAFTYYSKAKYQGAMRKGIEQVRETEKKATQAMVKGIEREKEARHEAKSAIAKRNFFG